MSRKIFVNLPVQDLARSKDFYCQLGFSINEQFSDDTGACVVISEEIYLMILTHDKFRQFTPGQICDAQKTTEVLICLSCDNREEVDTLVSKAVSAGGSTFRESVDHGFMYEHAFRDPDGHVWELVHMSAPVEA